jgi:non-ribosomal peptide synthetase component E (peptide arylation enzyme)
MQGKPMGRVLDDVVALDPDRVALIIGGEFTSYVELDRAINAAAAGLHAAGVRRGWRIPLVDDPSVLAVPRSSVPRISGRRPP